MRRALLALLAAVLTLSVVPAERAHAVDGWVELSGRVVDAKGQGLRHIPIELHDPAQPDPEFYRFAALTDATGAWTLRVGKGTYYVEANDPFYLHEFVTTYHPGTQDRSKAALVTFAPDEVRRFDFTLPGAFDAGRSATAVDTTSREAVASAYRTQVRDVLDVDNPEPPGDQVFTCQPVLDPATTRAMLSATNFVRGLAQTDPLTFDPDLSARTAYRTMVQDLNSTLDLESFDRLPQCWDQQRVTDSQASASTDQGPAARGVVEIMRDHARDVSGWEWVPPGTDVLEPSLLGIGAASRGSYTSLDPTYARRVPEAYPWGERPGPAGLPLRTWPTPGYFPETLLPTRWAVLLNNYSYDLSSATVDVQRVDLPGQPVVRVTPSSQGTRGLVWTPPAVAAPGRAGSVDYRVTLEKVRYRGAWAPTTTYTVRVFDPRGQVTVRTPAAVTGQAQVGSRLQAAVRWGQSGVVTTYGWLRDGKAIPGASAPVYTPGAADVGHRLSVRATGTRAGDLGASSTSTSTVAVVRKPATLAVKVTAGKRKVTLRVTVTTPGERVGGSVKVLEKGRRKATVSLRDGVGSVRLTKVKKGRHTYRVEFGGTDRLAATARTVKARVR